MINWEVESKDATGQVWTSGLGTGVTVKQFLQQRPDLKFIDSFLVDDKANEIPRSRIPYVSDMLADDAYQWVTQFGNAIPASTNPAPPPTTTVLPTPKPLVYPTLTPDEQRASALQAAGAAAAVASLPPLPGPQNLLPVAAAALFLYWLFR